MKLPIDVKAVLEAAGDIDAARKLPISVAVYMDDTAPGDLQGCVRQAFATSAEQVRVSIVYYPSPLARPDETADLAVIAAGLSDETGSLSQQLRDAGVPVMVITTMPDLVMQISSNAGAPLLADDLISPEIVIDGTSLASDADSATEPYPLSDELCASLLLRMGQWVVAAFREKRLAFALAFPFARKPLSLEAVSATSLQNGAVGLVMFIPGADMPIMTLNQAKMLLQIAAAYGQPLGMERVKELACVVGGGFACRSVARQLVGLVPAVGWAIKASIGYAGTEAMGHAAIQYFEGGGSMMAFADTVGKARDKVVKAAVAAGKQDNAASAIGAAARSIVGGVRIDPQTAAAHIKEGVPRAVSAVSTTAKQAGVSTQEVGKAVAEGIGSAVASARSKR